MVSVVGAVPARSLASSGDIPGFFSLRRIGMELGPPWEGSPYITPAARSSQAKQARRARRGRPEFLRDLL